jgi:O-antigen/teichoic acid export membrane protein
MSNTKTIAKNAGWYGLENVITAVVTVCTSVAIARTLGPEKMAYLIYVMWIAGIVSSLGGLGIPATTAKYMAEFIGKGDRGTARFIYIRTILLQIALASFATIGILIWILMSAPADYRLAAVLVVLSIWPAMVNSISAMANVATEQLSTNFPASVASVAFYFIAIGLTVALHWGVIGVGAAFLGMRLVDFTVRLIPTMKRILAWDSQHVQPEGLRKRMLVFASQSVASMIIALIVWNQSEIILLKHLCTDIRQIAFYSIAFSLSDRLLLSATIFGSAAATTIYAQYGRDKSRLADIAASSFRYLALTSTPLHFISAALAAPALFVLYGTKYNDAAIVVTLAPLLCLPKAFAAPIIGLLQSVERQTHVIFATVLAGVVDLTVAWWLIPSHGAVGACIGSGVAQIMAISGMWGVAIFVYKTKLPWLQLAKIAFASVVAALTAHFVAILFSPVLAIVLGGASSVVVLLALYSLMRVLEPQDRARLRILTGTLPLSIAGPTNALLSILIGRDAVPTEARNAEVSS